MCKRRIECDLQSDNHENKNLNVGIVNMSKTGDLIDSSDIIIYIIAAICIMMLMKWLQQTPGKDDKTESDADATFSASAAIPTVASSSTGTTCS